MSDKLERGYASVANEEYRKGYRDGWQDATRLKETMPNPGHPSGPEYPPMKPIPYEPGVPWDSACRVCGLKGIMGYVCHNPNCPTPRVTC